jgi:hypothetical protein
MAYFWRAIPTTAAGGLITLLDEILVTNANWSIYDAAAAANCKVYECATAGAEFYLWVDDNQADYAKVAIYETWDSGAHSGGGTNTSATDVRWRKSGHTLWMVNDTRVIYAHEAGVHTHAYYAGQLKRFVPAINSPILVGAKASPSSGGNPLGQGGTTSTDGVWLACNFTSSVVRTAYCIGRDATTGAIGIPFWKAVRRWYVSENIVYQATENIVLGRLDGAMATGADGDDAGMGFYKVILADGVQWIGWAGGQYVSVLRMD